MAITFTRGQTLIEEFGADTREVQMVTPVINGVAKAPLKWDAIVTDEVIAEHLAWLSRNKLLL